MKAKTAKKMILKIIVIVIITGLLAWMFTFTLTRKEVSKSRIENAASELEDTYIIVIIEGCEYIMSQSRVKNGSIGFMAHKGNCKNH